MHTRVGLWLGWSKVRHGERWVGQVLQFFFFLVPKLRGRRGILLAVIYLSIWVWGWSFDETLGTLMWGRLFLYQGLLEWF